MIPRPAFRGLTGCLFMDDAPFWRIFGTSRPITGPTGPASRTCGTDQNGSFSSPRLGRECYGLLHPHLPTDCRSNLHQTGADIVNQPFKRQHVGRASAVEGKGQTALTHPQRHTDRVDL